MSAGQAAGLLVLLGVVGVLAAIVGSGIEAGPVKFPSIPGSRQKPLAVTSALVIVGGVLWWVIQKPSGTNTQTTSNAVQTGPVTAEKLTVDLLPADNNIRVGQLLLVSSEVYDPTGQQLGSAQCELSWYDAVSKRFATTVCNGHFSEPRVSKAGIHRIVARADGRHGTLGMGSGKVDVSVSR